MTRIWSFLINTFLVATEGSFIKMLIISTFHYQKLKAKEGIAFFDSLLATYEPLHLAYVQAYNAWKASGGQEKGSTAALQDLLDDLSSDLIYTWDIAIQNVYKQKTPQYIAILPNRRKPYQKGSNTERINAVDTLVQAIGSIAALATLKAEIISFQSLLIAADTFKGGKQGDTSTNSLAVEAARVAAAVGQYGNLGLCMNHFRVTPEEAGVYFDQATIRNAIQTEFTHIVKANEHINIVKRTLKLTVLITITNTGNEPLTFYSAGQKNEAPGVVVHVVEIGQTRIFTPVEFGNSKQTPYINVQNKSDNDSSFDMTIK